MPQLKILSIGLELDGRSFESWGLKDAPSLSNYDAVVVDLEAVSLFVAEVIRGVKHQDRSGLPISPSGDGNVAGEVPIAELLRRRKREADTLLQNGGVLICFAHPSVNHRINQANWFIYDWLLSIASDSYHPRSIAAGDGEIGKADSSHPFTRYFSAFSGRLEYKVFFNQIFIDAHPGVKIIAQARSGEPVAVEVSPNNEAPGRLIFLPPISGFESNDEKKAAGVIQDCIVAGVDIDTSEFEPEWLEHCEMPGLSELDNAVAAIKKGIQQSELELAAAEEARNKVAHYKKLLWTTGKFQLEPVVRETLSLLGFDVAEEGDRDAVLFHAGSKTAIVEIEGSVGAVDVGKYRQLLDYVQDEFLESGDTLKGILIGNGFRLQEPNRRDVQFTERCLVGAEQQQYCLLDTTQLFEIAKAILTDGSEDMKTRIRNDILSTSGIYTFSNPT